MLLHVCSVFAGGLSLAILVGTYSKLAGTTLRPCWWWAVLSIVALTAADALIAAGMVDGYSAERCRYLAGITTFGPTIAYLGAKRPQDRAWQWIVLSGLVILALPALQSALLWPEAPLEVHPLWGWLMAALGVLTMANYSVTRFALSGILLGAVQLIFATPLLLHGSVRWTELLPLSNLLLATAMGLGVVVARFHGHEIDDPDLRPYRLFREFTQWYGLIWSFRVEDRVRSQTKTDLGPLEGDTPERLDAIWAALLPMLGRFVSAEWIEKCRPLTQPERGPSPALPGAGREPDRV